MEYLFALVASYGICFGLQNKFPFGLIYNRVGILDRMLACTYCTGFHTGWFTYLVWQYAAGDLTLSLSAGIYTLLFAFASAGASYGADALIQYLESYAAMVKAQIQS